MSYAFYWHEHLFMDWGHFKRCHVLYENQQWAWTERVLSWNPCNNIGELIFS